MIAAHERKIEAFIHLHFCQQMDEKRRRDRAQKTMTDHQGEERGFLNARHLFTAVTFISVVMLTVERCLVG